MSKKLNCVSGLNPGIIDKSIFEREISLCAKLSAENDGKCCWGRCQDCGVLPLLIKLHRGKLLEDRGEIKAIKNQLIGPGGDVGNKRIAEAGKGNLAE